jgi:protein-S-isoprenylcysteine O-methyltransferase Ste14
MVAGVVPGCLIGWRSGASYPAPLQAAGIVMVAIGAAVLIHAFVRFVREGVGTPAPAAPTQRLVVGGLYRYVRNPMYLAVLATITGQALILGRPVMLGYAATVAAAFIGFVRGYEEPTLARRYGAAYEEYQRTVPAWYPRRPRRPGR